MLINDTFKFICKLIKTTMYKSSIAACALKLTFLTSNWAFVEQLLFTPVVYALPKVLAFLFCKAMKREKEDIHIFTVLTFVGVFGEEIGKEPHSLQNFFGNISKHTPRRNKLHQFFFPKTH